MSFSRLQKTITATTAASLLAGCSFEQSNEETFESRTTAAASCSPYMTPLSDNQDILAAIGDETANAYISRISDGEIDPDEELIIDLAACVIPKGSRSLLEVDQMPYEDTTNPGLLVTIDGEIEGDSFSAFPCFVTGLVIDIVRETEDEFYFDLAFTEVGGAEQQLVEVVCEEPGETF